MATPLRIGMNILYLRPGNVGGSETYVRELVSAMLKRSDVKLHLFCNSAAAETFDSQPRLEIHPISATYSTRRRLWDENWTLAQHVRRSIDVLLSPVNFSPPLLPSRVPQVAVVHDLLYTQIKSDFLLPERLARTAMFWATLKRCRRLIAVSDSTRETLQEVFGVTDVVTVHEGVDANLRPSDDEIEGIRKHYSIQNDYFIYPAMATPHKNHLMLIRAFKEYVKGRERPIDLLLLGKNVSTNREIGEAISYHQLEGRVRKLGYVDERERVLALLSGSVALLYPSRFEGFGLPLLEAMVCEVPVVAANTSSIPEVVGEAAMLLDPDDTAQWALAMEQVSTKPSLRQDLVTRGRVNRTRFTWEACAEATLRELRLAAS